MAIAAISFGFVACDDDDKEKVNHTDSVVTAMAGTYTGTWTMIDLSTNAESGTESGTVTIADHKTANDCTVQVAGTSFSYSTPANIVWSNDDDAKIFQTQADAQGNEIGAGLSAYVTNGKSIDAIFQKTQRVGRKTVTVRYIFSGSK